MVVRKNCERVFDFHRSSGPTQIVGLVHTRMCAHTYIHVYVNDRRKTQDMTYTYYPSTRDGSPRQLTLSVVQDVVITLFS